MAEDNPRRVLIISCLAYIALGLMAAVFGPLLPELAALTGSNLAAVGVIFVMLFAGGLLAQLAAGPISDHFGARPVFLGGLLLGGLGMVALAFSRSLLALAACGFVTGIGQGGVDVGCNVMVARAYAGRNVAPLNWLHLFFGLGAVLGPALVSISLRTWATGMPGLWTSALMMLALLPFAWRLRALSAPAQTTHARLPAGHIYRSPILWAFVALFLLYVGTETAVGGWTAVYLQRTAAMALEGGALVASGYWLALTAGRLVSALLGARVPGRLIMWLDLAGSLLAACLMLVALGRAAPTTGAILLMGFSFGSVYPTAMALVASRFGGAGRAISSMSAAGSAGGMILPWLMGVLITNVSPQAGAVMVLLGCLGMLLCFVIPDRRSRSTRAREVTAES